MRSKCVCKTDVRVLVLGRARVSRAICRALATNPSAEQAHRAVTFQAIDEAPLAARGARALPRIPPFDLKPGFNCVSGLRH
jgi:hypothetical protein